MPERKNAILISIIDKREVALTPTSKTFATRNVGYTRALREGKEGYVAKDVGVLLLPRCLKEGEWGQLVSNLEVFQKLVEALHDFYKLLGEIEDGETKK